MCAVLGRVAAVTVKPAGKLGPVAQWLMKQSQCEVEKRKQQRGLGRPHVYKGMAGNKGTAVLKRSRQG